MMDFNERHPERGAHEIFLTNARSFEWENIPYLSKRKGAQAYAQDGKPVPKEDGAFPVFVMIKELSESLFLPGGI